MLRKNLAASTIGLVLTAFSFGVLAPAAEALTPAGSTTPLTVSDPNIQLAYVKKVVVKKKHKKTVFVYNRKRHGLRFRTKRAGYRYYYGGYWYPRPWWSICIGC
jgi:hypothetical protein